MVDDVAQAARDREEAEQEARAPQKAQLESQLEEYFSRSVRKLGGLCEKIAPTRWGLPDRMVIWPGGIIELVELKAHNGKLREAQSSWHEKALKRGVRVRVLVGRQGINAWLVYWGARLREGEQTHA